MLNLKETVIGIELGSTRIKSVLLNKEHEVLAPGSFTWENSHINGVWAYSMEDVRTGLQGCFADLKKDVLDKYGIKLTTTGAMGVSAMMHGYLPFDSEDNQICEFRTWRNTMTAQAAQILSDLFDFNIPQRWSIAHLYQAILNGEAHLPKLSYITTLSGHVHYLLTGVKVMGIGEASGMFPIDSDSLDYDAEMLDKFNALEEVRKYDFDIRKLLPKVVTAGADAGTLTEQGALYLDPTGELEPGIRFVPCEGDAGTGMAATNSVRVRTGNVSAGTSDFAMIVTDKKLNRHREVGMVTTPSGKPVAMVHCTNCTSDINAWVNLFKENLELFGFEVDTNTLYTKLFKAALDGENDCGSLMNFNYFAGESVTDLDEGRPVFLRKPDSNFTLANFMRTHMYSTLATLKIGLDILIGEAVDIDKIYGHGGFFKTEEVGQRTLSAAINAPVSVMKTAGEGGPYGMALLAAYALWRDEGETLEDYLDNKVFRNCESTTVMADPDEVRGFNAFIESYKRCLEVEKKAIENF